MMLLINMRFSRICVLLNSSLADRGLRYRFSQAAES